MGSAEPREPTIELILTLSGVLAIFALIAFFALEMTNPGVYVLPDRTIGVMLSIIAALLGFKSIHPIYQQRSDSGGGNQGGGNP